MIVDLSHFDDLEPLAFQKMALAGVTGFLHKATEGITIRDLTYAARKVEAKQQAASLPWGAYHFFRPDDPTTQASHFLRYCGQPDDWALDYEDPKGELDAAITFMEDVEKAVGKQMMIYGNRAVLGQQISVASAAQKSFLSARRLWWAEYDVQAPKIPSIWAKFDLWQWTQSGRVAGVVGKCDLNTSSMLPFAAAA
jgi:lysozyme